MTNVKELTEHIVGCRMAAMALVLATTVAVSASAQQTTADSAGSRAVPCTPAKVNAAAPSVSAGATGVTTYSASGETSATGSTTAAKGTPTDAGTTAGVPSSTTPNNTSTNPDKRLTGLNATNGANGVGADTTTTGKRTPAVAAQVPATDSARAGATVCAPAKGS